MPPKRNCTRSTQESYREHSSADYSDNGEPESHTTPEKPSRRGRKRKHDADDGLYTDNTTPARARRATKKIVKPGFQHQDESQINESQADAIVEPQSMTGREYIQLGYQLLMTEHNQLESVRLKLQELKQTKKEQQETIRKHSEYIHQLEKEASEFEGRLSAKQDHINLMGASIRKLQNKVACLVQEKKEEASGYCKVDDSYIVNEWQQISCNIYYLVARTVQATLVVPTNGFTSGKIKKLFENCNQAVSLRNIYLQKHIWSKLLQLVFSNKSKLWAGAVGETFTLFCKELRAELTAKPQPDASLLKNLSISKSNIAKQLGDAFISDETDYQNLATELFDEMSMFVRPQYAVSFVAEAAKILKKASCLHGIIMKSRALFHMGWNYEDVKPSKWAEYLEPYSGIKNTPEDVIAVKCVATPWLLKRGNADGEAFDQSCILAKARYVAMEVIKVEDGVNTPTKPVKIPTQRTKEQDNVIESNDELIGDSHQLPQEANERSLVKPEVRRQCQRMTPREMRRRSLDDQCEPQKKDISEHRQPSRCHTASPGAKIGPGISSGQGEGSGWQNQTQDIMETVEVIQKDMATEMEDVATEEASASTMDERN